VLTHTLVCCGPIVCCCLVHQHTLTDTCWMLTQQSLVDDIPSLQVGRNLLMTCVCVCVLTPPPPPPYPPQA